MSKPTKAKLHGYAKSPLGLPGMVIPVFKVGDGWFVQDTGKNGLVSCFEEIEVAKSDELMPAAAALTLAVGDEPVYAVALDEQHIIMGTKAGLVNELDFADPRLADLPELRADLAEFVENGDAFKKALREIEARAAGTKAKAKAKAKAEIEEWAEARRKAMSDLQAQAKGIKTVLALRAHPRLRLSMIKKLAERVAGEAKSEKNESGESTRHELGRTKFIVDSRPHTSVYGALESSGWLKEHASLEPEKITIKKLQSASSGQFVLVTVTTGQVETDIVVSFQNPESQNLIELLRPQEEEGGEGHHGGSFFGGKKRAGHGSHPYDKRLSERHSPQGEVYICDW